MEKQNVETKLDQPVVDEFDLPKFLDRRDELKAKADEELPFDLDNDDDEVFVQTEEEVGPLH